MTLTVRLGDETLEVRAHDLVQYDEQDAHLSIPYEAIRAARPGPYAPPAGAFTLANREVAYADVLAGHYRRGTAWTFVACEDPERAVVLELDGYDYALRPYERLVLGVEDPEAFLAGLERKRRGSDLDAVESADIAWTALVAGIPVVARDGQTVGTVTHPLGDLQEDLFEGVAFRATGLGAARMARPEDIARLTRQAVTLRLSAAEAAALPAVQLEDLREVRPGRGIFHRGPSWRRDDNWDGR